MTRSLTIITAAMALTAVSSISLAQDLAAPQINSFNGNQNSHLRRNLNHDRELQKIRLNNATSGTATPRR